MHSYEVITMKKLGIIGAGKVGVSLGIGLFSSGTLRVSGYYSRSEKSARYGAQRTNTKVYASLEELIRDADVILFATPDDAMEALWRQCLQFNISGKIFCHTAGSLSSSLFFDRTTKDVSACSLHPVLAISSREEGHRDLGSAFFTLEGDAAAVEVFRRALNDRDISYKVMETRDKAGYHLATAAMSNLAVALGKMATDLLAPYGFSEEEAMTALAPLATYNMENLVKKGPAAALTGPVERNDLSTVRRHLAVLDDADSADRLYRAASEMLTRIAETKHPERDYEPMRKLLKGEDR